MQTGNSNAAWNDDFSADEIVFFENKIRPLLAKHCLECHGAEKQESDLRLDTREAILKGGSSGDPGAIAGEPDGSLIIQSVRHSGDYDMPPNSKISDGEIADLGRWVADGLPWPKSKTAITKIGMPELLEDHRKNHWSFQKVTPPAIPKTKSKTGTKLDRFVAAKLESRDLPYSKRADKRTLIRRATFDLVGLPPSYDEVEQFVSDEDPNAYSKLIDRLLDSPHYGERWARHWLDVARYADTSGYAFNKGDRSYPFAFTYRDYVIKSFNNDLPYDQFIKEQLAADHLDVPADKSTLAALGFITVGRNFISSVDTFDDQVDVVTRGLMGLTVSCARCHDHKYDAIPTQDYYSLYSVFTNNYRPTELPLMGKPEDLKKFESFFSELDKLKANVESFRQLKHKQILEHIRTSLPDYLVRVAVPNQAFKVSEHEYLTVDEAHIRLRVTEKWTKFLARRHSNSKTILQKTTALIAIPNDGFAEKAKAMIDAWAANPKKANINPLLLKALTTNPIKSKTDVGAALGSIFEDVYKKWKADGSKQPAVDQFKGNEFHFANLLFNDSSPAMFQIKDIDSYLNQEERKEIRKLRDAVAKYNSQAPDGVARPRGSQYNRPFVATGTHPAP